MITFLLYFVRGAGLIGSLAAPEVDQTLQLKRHRSTEQGVCDLLNYAAVIANKVDDQKSSSLMAVRSTAMTTPLPLTHNATVVSLDPDAPQGNRTPHRRRS